MDLTILWVIVTIACLGLEFLLSASFFLLPFACGGLIALIAHLLGASFTTQIIAFIVVSIVCIPLLRPFARKLTQSSPEQKSGVDRIINAQAQVIKTIDGQIPGQIRVLGEVWLASAHDTTSRYNVDSLVYVHGVDGTRALVSKSPRA